MEKWSLRIAVTVLALAIAIRLGSSGVISKAMELLRSPEAVSAIMLLEAGRLTYPQTPQPTQPEVIPDPTQPTEITEPAPTQPVALPAFSPEDASLVRIKNVCGLTADVPTMLQSPLTWQLQSDQPTVLIVHSHGSESYENAENYKESGYYRTLDERYNMVSVGNRVAQLLEAGGIRVLHDTTLHDYPSYNDSYANSRTSVKEYLAQYPSIRLVLDLHRDAARDDDGNQVALTATVDGQKVAKLMLVVGTDVRLKHPNWPENMSLAVKLHAQLEKNYPGICRPISFRNQRFNQDLSTGALIIEVGAAGNSRQEALRSAELLASTILQLSHGTEAS